MAVNKVVKSDGTALIDLTSDTVTDASHIMEGYSGHLANGSSVTGTGKISASEQEALDALVRYSNETTGENDTTISEAVDTLVNGYKDEHSIINDKGNIKALITNGGEYINTGFYPDSTVFYIVDVKILQFTQYAHLFGATNASDRILCQFSDNESDGLTTSAWTRSDYSRSASKVTIGNRFISCLSGGFAEYDGDVQTATITATSPLYIFRGYWDGWAETPTIKCEFYGMKVVKTNTLEIVHNYVPWLENSTPCVKDTITGDLLYNEGSGTFGYIELD